MAAKSGRRKKKTRKALPKSLVISDSESLEDPKTLRKFWDDYFKRLEVAIRKIERRQWEAHRNRKPNLIRKIA
ncbi:MAG: hypothetical protein A3K06_02930 [Candidatus Doudnabacteria bacterium RIFCSPHIGHO2_01_52_17]|uniref:Uncharacterized protein n=1 Tax=Candidatus Doudnabacteria bacterium RIFCSPHIGHO2_01_52_17 TaxID=1817820 RepID=A0A1F5NAN8_9BACT|nr:MAG: hypothetical protein A3K06_02930 [Candidatus Doudnabacteria bacterium RIFCSPHIGHO2_01_52_17]